MERDNLKMYSLVVTIALGLVACSKTPSSNVKTSGIHGSFSVVANQQGGVTCKAEFQVGGGTGTFLELDDGDTVTCQGQVMARSEFAGIVTYSVPLQPIPGGQYSVVFTRPNESPYRATVTLPEPIAGLNPTAMSSFQKGRPFQVNWTPSSNPADQMQVTLSFKTGQSYRMAFESGGHPEVGFANFSASDTSSNPPEPGTWGGDITFSRYRVGQMPTGLGGEIKGTQEVKLAVQLKD